jgi:hypothetical protein
LIYFYNPLRSLIPEGKWLNTALKSPLARGRERCLQFPYNIFRGTAPFFMSFNDFWILIWDGHNVKLFKYKKEAFIENKSFADLLSRQLNKHFKVCYKKVLFIIVSPLLKGPAISDLWDTFWLHTMYLPTPTTMPGARRIEIGNHSF